MSSHVMEKGDAGGEGPAIDREAQVSTRIPLRERLWRALAAGPRAFEV